MSKEEIPDLGSDAQKQLTASQSANTKEILSQIDYALESELSQMRAKSIVPFYKYLIKEGATGLDAMHIALISQMPEQYGMFVKKRDKKESNE